MPVAKKHLGTLIKYRLLQGRLAHACKPSTDERQMDYKFEGILGDIVEMFRTQACKYDDDESCDRLFKALETG